MPYIGCAARTALIPLSVGAAIFVDDCALLALMGVIVAVVLNPGEGRFTSQLATLLCPLMATMSRADVQQAGYQR